jgi:hypothetical protein
MLAQDADLQKAQRRLALDIGRQPRVAEGHASKVGEHKPLRLRQD